jgi:hypothetical protein
MKTHQQRNLIRWIHLITGGLIATYVYSPWHKIYEFQLLIKFIVIPALIVSGIWLWKGTWIQKILKTKNGNT